MEDRAFRARVAPALQQAGELEASADAWPVDGQRYVDADTAIVRFRNAVAFLPTPKAKEHRYLAMRLQKLAEVATDLRAAHKDSQQLAGLIPTYAPASSSPAFVQSADYERTKSQEFQRELVIVAAAERICLGTSRLEDQARAQLAGSPGDSTGVQAREAENNFRNTEEMMRRDIAKIR
jgi:hypothetical protein